jgi:hypothetical protein
MWPLELGRGFADGNRFFDAGAIGTEPNAMNEIG